MQRQDLVAPALVFVAGLATILAAWAFQVIGGYVPCALCLQQRWPYYIGLPLVATSLISGWLNGPRWLTHGALALAGAAFLFGAYLGLYHAGVEWAWWEGPADCGGTGAGTSGNILQQIEDIRIVSCTDASWRFPAGWGLSFAGWNAVISLVLGLTAIAAAARKPTRS
jgi:disulfide bond formation protein DsbB